MQRHALKQGGTAMPTIRRLREDRGETQRQLAEAVGVRHDVVAAWEQGAARPSVSALRALTARFGVDEPDLDLDPCDPPSLGEQLLEALEPQA